MTSTTSAAALPRPFGPAHVADPHATYRRLRAQAPVHRVALPDGSPVWLVLREEDVRAGLSDPRLSVDKRHAAGGGYRGFDLPPALDANLLNMDAGDHLRLRRLVSQAFTPRHVETLRGHIRGTAERLADALEQELASAPCADLVAAFANPLPLTVVADLLAVPVPDRPAFSAWANTMLDPSSREQLATAVAEIHRFLLGLVAARRADPGTDLLSALITARDEGDRLSEDELVSLAFLILLAGSENSRHLISAGLLTLFQHPDQLAALCADPGLIPQAVEELLRHAHPNHMAIRRFPTQEVEIAGTRIPAGDTVLLCLASAHRDPDRYPYPDRFDIHRSDKAHLALGQGMHYCLGAPLARMEVQIALHTLLERFPRLVLATGPEQPMWRTSFRSHGLTCLPVAADGSES